MRQAIICPGEHGFWAAECPSLPGCVSQSESRDAAVTNIRKAIGGYDLALHDDGLPVPQECFDVLLLAKEGSLNGFPAPKSFARF